MIKKRSAGASGDGDGDGMLARQSKPIRFINKLNRHESHKKW